MKLLFCTAFGAEKGDAPAKMNETKPELFFDGGARTEPFFEVGVRRLPICPIGGSGVDGAGGGTEIVNIEWLENEGWFAFGFFEIVEDKFGVFGKIERLVESDIFGDVGAVEFVDGGIHAPVDGEKIEEVGFWRFFEVARTERINVDICSGMLTEAFVMNAADGESGGFL